MARKKKAKVYHEEFKSSFGVNASVPDPHTSGKTVKTPLDDSDPQEPMQQLDDKGSRLKGGGEPKPETAMHETLQTKAGMMNEILKVLRDSSKEKVAETFAHIQEEDDPETNVDIHIDGQHDDDGKESEKEEDDEDEKKDMKEARSYLRDSIVRSLYEDDSEDTADVDSEDDGEKKVYDENYEFGRRFVWEDTDEDELELEEEFEDLYEEDDKPPFMKKKDDGDDDDDKGDDDDDDSEDESKREVNVTINDGDKKEEVKEFTAIGRDDLIMEYNIDGLFQGGKFSKQFINKTKAIFESAVLANVNANLAVLNEKAQKSALNEAKKLRENLVEDLNSYLSYVVENFIEENRLAVETGLRLEVYENFMHELKGLFERHYIHVPEDKTDLVDVMAEKLDKTEGDLNEEIQRNIRLSAENEKLKRSMVFENVTAGMPQSHRARLANLSENIEYVNEHDFEDKLSDMKKLLVTETVSPMKVRKPARKDNLFDNDYDGMGLPRSTDNNLMEAVVAKIDHLSKKL